MTKFRDALDREWVIHVGLAELIAIKAELGLVLVDLTDEDRAAKRSETDRARIAGDPALWVAMLYILCRKKCDELGVSDEEFGTGFDLDSLTEGLGAIHEELTVFSLPRSQKDRGRQLARKRVDLVRKRIESSTASEIDEREIQPLTAEERATLDELLPAG